MDRLVLADFSGGRNTLAPMNAIAKNETPDQENTWNEFNGLAQRRGFTTKTISLNGKTPSPNQLKATALAASGNCRLAIIGDVAADSQRYLLKTDDNSTFAWCGYTTGTISITGSAVTGSGTAWTANVAVGDWLVANGSATKIDAVGSDTSLTLHSAPGDVGGGTAYTVIQKIAEGVICAMETFDVSGAQNLFLSDGTRAYRYDGTTMLRLDGGSVNMPPCQQLIRHKNYLFAIALNATKIQWSTILDASSSNGWPAANFQTVTDSASPLRGGIVYGDHLVLFSRHRMFRLLGDVFDPINPTYFLQEITVPPNFDFHFSRSPCVHGGLLYFLTSDGWYVYYGGPSIEKVGQQIQTDVDGFYQPLFGGETSQTGAKAVSWKGRMWVTLPDNSKTPTNEVNCIYLLDQNKKWWKWPTAANSAAGDFFDLEVCKFASGYQLIGGCLGTNKLSTLDTGTTDDGFSPSGYYVTPEIVYPHDVEMVYLDVTLKLQSAGNLSVGLSVDRRAYVTLTADMSTGAGTVIRRRIPINRIGKALRIKLSNATAGQTFEVYSLELYTNPSEAIRA